MSDVDKAVPVCSFVILCSDHVDAHDFFLYKVCKFMGVYDPLLVKYCYRLSAAVLDRHS